MAPLEGRFFKLMCVFSVPLLINVFRKMSLFVLLSGHVYLYTHQCIIRRTECNVFYFLYFLFYVHLSIKSVLKCDLFLYIFVYIGIVYMYTKL